MAFLRAFVDDSASEIGDQRLFMAGYVARSDTWEAFADAWDAALRASPSIAYLRMVEANGLHGEIDGWDEARRNNKLRRLSEVIRSFKTCSFEFSISRKLYWSEVKPVAPRGIGNPYFPCAFSVVSGVARVLESQGIRLPIEFIFDDQKEISSDINLFFEDMKKSLPKQVQQLINGNPLFRDDKLFLPLQAADMLVWHIRREYENSIMIEMAAALRSSSGHISSKIDNDVVKSWSREMAVIMKGVPPIRTKSQWRAAKRGIAAALERGFVPPYGSVWKNALYGARDQIGRYLRKIRQ